MFMRILTKPVYNSIINSTPGVTNADMCASLTDATGLIRHLLTPDAKKRATIDVICRHWWINLNYDCTPIEQYPPIKLIDVASLERVINNSSTHSDSSSDSDGETVQIETARPVKGILKKTKSVSADDDVVANESVISIGGSTDACENSPPRDVAQKSSSPVDSQVQPHLSRKPRRGILKNSRQSNSDSGLDEADLSFVAPSGSCESVTKDDDCSYDLCDIEAILGEHDDATNHNTDTASCSSPVERTTDSSNERLSASEGRNCDRVDDGNELPHLNSSGASSFSHAAAVSSTPSQPVKGILKRRRKLSCDRDPTWRYSLGSQGSNSSGDILDFSYDDTDTYLTDCLTTVVETKPQFCYNGRLGTTPDDDDYGPPPPLPSTAPPRHRHSGIYLDDDDITQNSNSLEEIMNRLHVDTTSLKQPCIESVDFFDLTEARQVCQQALSIGSNWG